MSEPHKHTDRMKLLDIKSKAVKRMEWDNDRNMDVALQEAFQCGYESGEIEGRKKAQDDMRQAAQERLDEECAQLTQL